MSSSKNASNRTSWLSASTFAVALVLTASPAFAHDPTPRPRREERPKVMMVPGVEGMPRQGMMKQMILGRGFLGLNLNDITPELRRHFGAPEDAGMLVASLASGGPAERAGVEVGDVIISINGENVSSHMDVLGLIRPLKQGDAANLEVVRDGRRQSIAVTIEERERQKVDLGDQMYWKSFGDGDFNMMFVPDGKGGTAWTQAIALEGLGDRLKAIDWEEIAERTGRSTADLEARIADLEKKLADLSKKLEAAARDR